MTLLVFERLGSVFPPDREILEIESDGRFRMWRSYANTTVGRFSGIVPSLDALRRLIDAVGEPPELGPIELESGASEETLALHGREPLTLPGERPSGPLGELIGEVHRLLDRLVDQPEAAIEASLPHRDVLRLGHVGHAILPVEFGSLSIELTKWHEGVQTGWSVSQPGTLDQVDVGPGWSVQIPLDRTAVEPPGQLVVTATFVADDNGVYAPVVATARA